MSEQNESIFKQEKESAPEDILKNSVIQDEVGSEEEKPHVFVEDEEIPETEAGAEIEKEAGERLLRSDAEFLAARMEEDLATMGNDGMEIKGLIPAGRRKRAEMYFSDRNIITRGDTLSVETPQKRRYDTFIMLVASLRGGKLIKGRISGVKTYDNGNEPCAMVLIGEWSIYIPASRLIPKDRMPNKLDKENPNGQFANIIIQREGSEIQFVITGIDEENMIAVGDRLQAMAQLRLAYFWKIDKKTNRPRINEGESVEGAVQFVTPHGLGLEVFGYEAYIPARDVSYNHITVNHHYRPGQTVLVKIAELERKRNGKQLEMRIHLSVKETEKDPKEQYFNNFVVGGLYDADVTWIDKDGMYVLIDKKLESRIRFDVGEIPLVGDRIKVVVTRKFDDTKRIECKKLWTLPRIKEGFYL